MIQIRTFCCAGEPMRIITSWLRPRPAGQLCRGGAYPRINQGSRPVVNPGSYPGADAADGAGGHAGGMNTAAYLINPSFIFMVIRQIREHPLDARSLASLVLAAGCAAVMFLYAAPAGGNDIALEAACLATGEFACQGPEVDPLALAADGTHGSIRRLGSALDPICGQDAAAAA